MFAKAPADAVAQTSNQEGQRPALSEASLLLAYTEAFMWSLLSASLFVSSVDW